MIIGKKLKEMPVCVGVDSEKCINCHACITACPVKYCNDGSGDFVSVNPYMCIGCGTCVKKCSHGARVWLDDFDAFMEDLAAGQKTVVIVAPSAASSFPSTLLNLNGWLRSIGVQAVFDVSFGAELTVKSYIEYLQSVNRREPVISQPCPAIIAYIQLYLPELIPYCAPIDSPMVHTMKMIKKYYPQFADHKIAALSPCLAKKLEFHATGLGDYNIGFLSLIKYFEKHNIDLLHYPPENYTNPPAERAVGFSSPGGLLKTAERWVPGISGESRKIEGPENIYPYLDRLSQSIVRKTSPVLIDCLNCERGCNGGPLTSTANLPLDDIEKTIKKRSEEAISIYGEHDDPNTGFSSSRINDLLSEFWEPGLYNRSYTDLSINNRIIIPSKDELNKIFKMMRKSSEADFYNCSACGYGNCEHMAIAIYNGLNRPENCHFYLAEEAKLKSENISENERRLRNILSSTSAGFCLADEEFKLIVVNSSFCNFVGMDREKLIGSTYFKKQFERCSSGNGYSSEIRINRTDVNTAYYLFIANPYIDENKEILGYFALIVDINRYRRETDTGSITKNDTFKQMSS
jgi:PAS domain S-box-containing protein